MAAQPGEWVDGHTLGQTRLCARPGCDLDADRDDGYCSGCRARNGNGAAGRDTPRRRSDAPATFPCHTEGCDGRATSLAGRYAYCVDCQVERGTRSADGTVRWSPRHDGPDVQLRRRVSGSHTPPGRLETAGLELALAGRRVDRALVAMREAREEATAAIVEWESLVSRLPRAARDR